MKIKRRGQRYDWQSWFAWCPVLIGEYTYWLCRVERRKVHLGPNNTYFEYRTVDPYRKPDAWYRNAGR